MKELMLGNEAIARGAYEAGVTVATAYPGTPSTEITETISRYQEIYCEWAPNEKVALEVAAGAAIGGARAICAMKHVGLNVAADPLFTLSYTGINGGLVIVVADDPGMHSSQNEQDSRYYALAAKLPMVEPADAQECRDYILAAFALSEEYDTPVLVRLSTRVAHTRGVVMTGERKGVPLRDYLKNAPKFVMLPGNARQRREVVEERMARLAEAANTHLLNRVETGNGKTAVITSGIAYQYAREVFGEVSYLKLGMVHPLPERMVLDFAQGREEIYVVEEGDPFLELQLKALGIRVTGKKLLPATGELLPGVLRERISGTTPKDEEEETKAGTEEAGEAIPVRPPVLCPGCPHRGVFYVLKKLGLTVLGDIGCYTLGALPPAGAMDACVCMGASIGMLHGMEKARGPEFAGKAVAVIGDSTFIHSGITGLTDLVYNKGRGTVIILDNNTTGMTGHQHHPGTGFDLRGEPTYRLDLVQVAQAVGVRRVRVVDPFALAELEEAIKEEVAAEEPSVIIARRPCFLLNRGKTVPVRVDEGKCTACRRCLAIGCPAVVVKRTAGEKKGRIVINETLCTGCMLCTQLCPFGAIERVEK
jgi:indolepyruvate ferredoxin oxidoreductase alpha subunit